MNVELRVGNRYRIGQKIGSGSFGEIFRGFPPELSAYMNYIRSLRFEDKPDYGYLKRIFRELFIREGFHIDYVFDWTLKRIHESLQDQQQMPNGANGGNIAPQQEGAQNEEGEREEDNGANNNP
eukprot:gene5547-4002_t